VIGDAGAGDALLVVAGVVAGVVARTDEELTQCLDGVDRAASRTARTLTERDMRPPDERLS
jgi:hypothetical protein